MVEVPTVASGRMMDNPVVRGLLIFSPTRPAYRPGILVFTVLIATNDATPWWASLVFLATSMVFSRWLFKRLKERWPGLFAPRENESVS